MKIRNRNLLKAALALKGGLSGGVTPPQRGCDGVEVAPFKHDCKVGVSISADFELNWAWRALEPNRADRYSEATRRDFPLMLGLARDYGVPITWATVGHLFLSECRREGGVPHNGMPRPPMNPLWEGDWYRHDPCTRLGDNPQWYSPDLIEQILQEPVGHELGTHSFSHIDFSPEHSSEELVEREIEECIRAMAPFGLRPSSLVFPFNRTGPYLDLLSRLGITSVRWPESSVLLSYPERTSSGVYKIYQSMSLFSPRRYELVDRCRIMLRQAAERRAAYHFWFHPSDGTELFSNEFRLVLACLAEERQTGVAWTTTMREMTAYCEARDGVSLRVEREANRLKVTLDNSADLAKYGPAELTLVFSDTDQPRFARALVSSGERLEEQAAQIDSISGRRLVVTVPDRTRVLELVY
jgi:hypothetical protein